MPSPPLSALLASVAGLDSALPALPTLSVRQLRPFQSRPWTYSSGTARVACFVSRFEKMAKILDRDIPLSVRGYVFEAFSLGICRFIPPYCFFGRKNVSRFEKTAEISNRDTFRETPPLTYASPRTYAPPPATCHAPHRSGTLCAGQPCSTDSIARFSFVVTVSPYLAFTPICRAT